MKSLKAKVCYDRKIYDLKITIYAPKEPAQLILQLIHRTLKNKGVLLNG